MLTCFESGGDEANRELEERLATEIRRRSEPVAEELKRNLASIGRLKSGYSKTPPGEGQVPIIHPELLDGAWSANAPRLTEIVADYELTSSLASTYGRIEELRWRIRQRTATLAVSAGSDVATRLADALQEITEPLLGELDTELVDLLARVRAQIESPDVQPLGLLHRDAGTVTVRITASGEEG